MLYKILEMYLRCYLDIPEICLEYIVDLTFISNNFYIYLFYLRYIPDVHEINVEIYLIYSLNIHKI